MIRRLLAVLSIVLLLGMLAACGDEPGETNIKGDGDTSSPSVDPTSPSPSVNSTPVPTVTSVTSAPPATSTSAPPTVEPTPDEPPVDPNAPATTYDAAVAQFDAAAGAKTITDARFQADRANLYCALAVEFIPPSCELGEGTIPDAKRCQAAPTENIGRVEFYEGSFQPVCNTDTIREPGAPSARSGTIVERAELSIKCLVKGPSVTCINTELKQGFFLGRGEYHVFVA